ncbi:hypothetical protein GCM10023191_010430 [Actinoallomurus oryzae]|uniref:Uncharacterized protein n=1 Tax=Actinoallomurus oryzae TaxID=502180 RepID=A0ABP8PDU3_9ACTN
MQRQVGDADADEEKKSQRAVEQQAPATKEGFHPLQRHGPGWGEPDTSLKGSCVRGDVVRRLHIAPLWQMSWPMAYRPRHGAVTGQASFRKLSGQTRVAVTFGHQDLGP